MRMNWKRIMMPLGVLLFGAMVAIACSDSEVKREIPVMGICLPRMYGAD